jgi:hypothetical protein
MVADMKTIWRRQLDMRSGSEGPRHDPYGFTELLFTENDTTVRLHMGLGISLTINGHSWDGTYGEKLLKFKELTGMSHTEFDETYSRLHPYFEDPMGSPSSYM